MRSTLTPRLRVDFRARYKMPRQRLDNVQYCVICTVRQNVKRNTMQITLNGLSHLVVERIRRKSKVASPPLLAKVVISKGRRLTLRMVPYSIIYIETPGITGLSSLVDTLIRKTLFTSSYLAAESIAAT